MERMCLVNVDESDLRLMRLRIEKEILKFLNFIQKHFYILYKKINKNTYGDFLNSH
jgi:hypothetical protein